ncbi:MAG: CidA/LrgA family protein [Phycisphaerales bacterium]|nr:CidA/LrgA family protein [Phycisphaerales bacterium]
MVSPKKRPPPSLSPVLRYYTPMLGLALLLLFNLLGVVLQKYAHVPLPSNVIGLLLLLLALHLKIVRLRWVEDAAGFLLKHMMLLFAPVIVSTLALTDLLATNWLPILATILLSTLITLLATALIANLFTQDQTP